MENVKKKRKLSKRKIALIAVSSVLLCILIAVGVLFGPGLFAKKAPPVEAPSTAKSMRKEAPTDGTLPTEVSDPLDNIAYLAYVLDNQPYFKNYAYNSTVAMGYEQITKSWKDYKGAELTGIGKSVMVCSDLTHSLLVKSATQTCFVGGSDAYLRTGNKPGADTLPTEIGWSEDVTRYTHDSYLTAYGEFSTELTVYVINEETVESVGEVKDNGDGTYSQSVSLTPQAACWYQYGMKTRGSLKGFPVFHTIDITFTYDAKWQVLESYCVEDATIAPSALGGSPQSSASKTTTTFTYGAEAIDEKHFAYFDDYYKSRLDVSTDGGEVKPVEPDMLGVLGSGFRNVMDASRGQQFSLALKLGETEYEGKAYAKLGDMGDVLGTLDVRLALGKKDGGNQDFYLEFAGGNINAYYGNSFAMTANLDRVSASVKNLTDKIKELASSGEKVSVYSLLAAGEDGDEEFDFNAILEQFGFGLSETGAVITIKSDDLLGLGIGVDAVMNFSRIMDETGGIFDFESFSLNSLSFGGENLALSASLAPDESEPITRDKTATPADLSEYIDGVYKLLDSNTVKADISLADKLVEGLSLDAAAYINIAENLAARVDVSAEYKGISLKLNAYYEYDENYGKIYVNLTELNGQQLNAKVYCPVGELLETVKKLTGGLGNAGGVNESEFESLAAVINKVLNLDFSKIIGKVSGDAQKITLGVNVDKLLAGLDISAGFEIGELSLELLNDGGTLTLNGSLPELGLGLSVSGCDYALTLPEDKGNYIDIFDYVDSVFALLNADVIEVNLQFADKLVEGLTAQATAYVAVGEPISARVDIAVSYNEISVKLNAYYVYDGGYGKVYINVTELNGQQLSAKIYCDIKDTAEAIQKLIGTQTAAEIQMPEITASKVIEVILKLDFNKLLKVDNEKLTVTVNADEVLNGLGINLGVSFGEITLDYEKATSNLTGNVPALGVALNVSASNSEVTEPADKENYVDILDYVNNIANLVLGGKYHLGLEFDGAKTEIKEVKAVYAKLSAEVEFKGENKTVLAVSLTNATAKYENITLIFNAYYEIDLKSGTYGKIYLNVTELNGQQLNAKIYCDVKDTAEAIQKLIGTQTAAEIQIPEITASKVIEVILKLDFNKLLKVDNEKLAITVNADEVLSGLGINLGVSFGEITLNYEKATSYLTGNIPALGATLNVSASKAEVQEPVDKENYVDILDYVNNVANLVLGGKYHLGLEFDGAKTEIKEVKAVYAKLSAEVEFKGENKTVLAVSLTNATAKYENITLKFNAYYEIDLKSGTYGKIYLNVTELNGQRLNAKIYCDIKDTAEAIQKLIGTQTAAEIQMPEITASKVIEVILKLDFNKLLKVDNEKLSITVNADEVLSGLGIDLGISFGEITLNYEKATSNLTGNIPALGVALNVSASKAEVTEPADKENYVDILDYVNNIANLVLGGKYHFGLEFDGAKTEIKEVKAVYAKLSAEVEFKGENKTVLAVQLNDATAKYENITIKFNAYYEIDLKSGTYGKIYLNVTELNGQQLNAKIYCDVKDTAEAIQKLIGTQTAAEIQMPEITVSKVVEVILKLDFNKLLKVDNEKLAITVNADEVLNGLGIDLGVSFGEITLNYEKATSVLTGNVPALGVALNVSASKAEVTEPADKENYVDILDYVNNIANLVLGGKYHFGLEFDGAKTEIKEVKAVYAKLSAEVEFKGENKTVLAVQLNDATAKYENITIKFNAYYEIDLKSGTYGKIYLNVTELNGQQLNAKIYCDVKDTAEAIQKLIGTQTAAEIPMPEITVSKVIEVILKLDFNKLLKVDNEKLAIMVNADEVLSGLGINLGVSFGEITLDYEKATSYLTGNIPALGVNLNVSASKAEVTEPADKENYLNANDLIALINSAIDEVNKIIDCKDVSFTVNAKYEKDGVSALINGTGEVIWTKGGVKVALSLDVKVLQNGENTQFTFGFVYDRTAYNGENPEKPFAIVTINDTGLKVYRSETDNLAETFGGLIAAIKNLTSGDKTVAPAASGYSAYGARNVEIKDILYNENVNKILSALLEFAGKLTIGLEDIDGDTAYELVIRHAADGSLTVQTDGCLALSCKVKDFAVSLSAEAGEGLTVNAILNSFEEGYNFYEDIDSFAKYILNEVLNSLDGFTLKDVLGTDSYSIDFVIDGKESGLKALENVYIKGETYYTENLTDGRLGNNLFKTDLHFVINGTAAEASLSYSARNIYVSLTEVGNLKFADLKFKTGADELYSAIEQLVRLITDTNLISLLGGNAAYSSGEENIQVFAEGENTVLTDVLYAFLNMNFAESFKLDKENGTAEINIDDILEAAAGVKIGTVKIAADKKNHVVSASVTSGESAWLNFEANPATFDDNDKNRINPDDYIEVGFIATLLSDLKNILTDDNGDIYKLYTYTGTIKAHIIVAGDVSLNNVTLTLGFDENGGLYFTLAARLESKTFIWDAADIGITYSHGFLTLSRNMGTDGEEYKIMTIEYLLDNLFNKQSPIAWLLGMNSSTWSTIMNMAVKDVNVSSGLTTPQTYNLYEIQQVLADSRINIANYFAGMKVALNGLSVSEYGNAASGALSKFGDMGGNYYAFDLKAKELTGNVLTELYAAITRSDSQGINGIKAYGAIQSYVTFTLDLNTYREGITATFDGADENYLYSPSSPDFGKVAAPDYYGYVERTYGFDKGHIFEATAGSHFTPVFGCFEAGKGVTSNYIASNVLETVFLDVYDGEEVVKTLEVRYGSTVNLVSAFPEFASDGRKLIYIDANGERLPSSVVIEEGGVLPIVDGRVSVYKSSEEAQAVTFDFSGLIQPVTAALGDGEALAAYDLAGYTFLGWYSNPQFTGDRLENVSEIIPVDGVKTVYGWYVKTEIMVNGVIYTFNADNGGHYAVTGFGETEIKPFTAENSVLRLENSFVFGNREYKVTAISEGAFANAMLKNVVVPSNIVTVGKLAFLNNYGIRSVTFLADSVYMQGGTLTGYTAFDANVTNDSPFYNCGASDGARTTLLNVYYNEITCDGDKNWRHFRREQVWVPVGADHYFIGTNGGSVNAKGNWAYTEYTLNAHLMSLSEFGLSNGVTTNLELLDCAALENYIKGILDAKTASEFVNGYAVTVTSSTAEGKTLFVITITQNSVSDRYYKFNLTVADESAANAVIEAEHTVFGGETFIKCDATVKVLPAIDGFTVNTVSSSQNVSAVENEDIITFVMPDGVVEMRVACSKKTIKEVKIISEKVSFTYDGSKAANEYTVRGVEEGVTELSAPQADGYYFLGWTYLDGDNLVFCDSTVTYSVYYPVWGVKRDVLEVSGTIAVGGSPNAEANGLDLTVAEGAAFYKWYKDAAFVSEADILKKTDTLLYSRMQYNLNVTVSGKCREVAIGSVKDSNGVAKNLKVTKDFSIYEGETIYVKNAGNNKKDYYIGRETVNGKEDFSGQIYIKEYSWSSATVKAVEISAKMNGDTVNLSSENNDAYAYYTVSGNLTLSFTN